MFLLLPLALTAVIALFAQPALAQRPRDAEAALIEFAAIADRAEPERRHAVQALGAFAEPAVTALLLRELAAAREPGYRQELLRALGRQLRPEAIPGLLAALRNETNPRLLDSAAAALVAQGDPGVAALAALLDEPPPSGPGVERSRRTAVLTALGTSPLPAARARLCRELRASSGRDRLPVLRALAAVRDDAAVVALRQELAADPDPVVAAAALAQLAEQRDPAAADLALALHRRGKDLDLEAHTAIAHGLLIAPTPAIFGILLGHAARADAPVEQARAPLWQQLLGDDAFVRFLATTGVSSKSADERRLAAVLLGRAPAASDAVALTGLDRLLQKDEPVVAAAAIAALQQRGGDAGRARLERLVERGADALAAMALAARGATGPDPGVTALLLLHASGARPQLRATALDLLADLRPLPEAALAPTLAGLTHRLWSVRAAAIRLAVALRHRDGIPALIERLADDELRLRADARAALRSLTGANFGDVDDWRAWWRRDGANFVVPTVPAAAAPARDRRDDAAATVTYWNIPVSSQRIAFVVDTSGSMNQPFGTAGQTRLAEAQRQFERAIAQLPERARCNLIAFSDDAHSFADRLQPADGKHRNAMTAMAQGLTARGPTNVYAALQRAFADADVDTVFLLTDGHPSSGAIVDPTTLAATVRLWNRGRGIAIHTIALGGKSEFLEQLARESGGEHTVAR